MKFVAAVAATTMAVARATPQRPYLGIDALNQPTVSADGSRASLNVEQTYDNDRRLRLAYDVEHADDSFLLKLDEVTGVDTVDCTADSLSVTFESLEDAQALVDSIEATGHDQVLVTGGPQWGCLKRSIRKGTARRLEMTTPAGVILRKAPVSSDGLSVTVDADEATATLVLQTEDAQYSDVFSKAQIRFATSAFPASEFVVRDHRAEKQTAIADADDDDINTATLARSLLTSRLKQTDVRDRQLSWFKKTVKKVTKAVVKTVSSVAKGVEKTAKEVVDAVEDTADIVKDAAELLVTGDLDVDKTETLADLAWNYNGAGGATNSAIDLMTDVTCNNCYFNAELDLLFDLDISNYKVDYFKISVEGSLESNLETDLEADYTKSWNYAETIATIDLPTITFSISGVPITISSSCPITLGLNASLQAEAKASISGSATGNAEYGLQYQDGSFSWINDKTFSATGDLGELTASATGVASLWVEPEMTISIEHIGGPVFTAKPHVDLTVIGTVGVDIAELLGVDAADISDEGDTTDSCPDGVSVSLSWGFEATIGASIDITILDLDAFSYSWPTHTIYSISDPLKSGCYSVSSIDDGSRQLTDGNVLTPYTTLEGGDLLSGWINAGELAFTDKCSFLYNGAPDAYLHVHMRVAEADHGAGDNGEDVFRVVSTINYASTSSDTPFACVDQKVFTWQTFSDSWGTMVAADDQDGLNFTSCTNAGVPSLEYVCSAYDGYSVLCSDTSSCVNVELFKDSTMTTSPSDTTMTTTYSSLTSDDGIVGKEVSSKCYAPSDLHTCASTSGCGWCISSTGAQGCVRGPNPATSLPWVTPEGVTLSDCLKSFTEV